jgi:hypothetical protein
MSYQAPKFGRRRQTRSGPLALWVAAGGQISTWCHDHGIPRGTAYDWSKRAEFRRMVEDYRRRAVDRAIGKMARQLIKAVEMIVHLIEQGQKDSIKLAAARILIDKLLDVQCHAELKAELRQLNDRLAVQEERDAQRAETPAGADRPA